MTLCFFAGLSSCGLWRFCGFNALRLGLSQWGQRSLACCLAFDIHYAPRYSEQLKSQSSEGRGTWPSPGVELQPLAARLVSHESAHHKQFQWRVQPSTRDWIWPSSPERWRPKSQILWVRVGPRKHPPATQTIWWRGPWGSDPTSSFQARSNLEL